MFKSTYNKIKEFTTRNNRREMYRLSISIKEKGVNGKLSRKERDLIKKIDSHIERSHYDSNITREKILNWLSKIFNDELCEFACQHFVKDATKMTISERAQIEHMKSRSFEMSKLPASGKNSLRFDENSLNIISTKIEGITSRSFDYKREYSGMVEYFTGKVTFGQGGAQNNMKEEIVNFLKKSNNFLVQNPNSNFVFTALVDGDALTENDLLSFQKYTSERVRLMNSDNYTPYVSI